MVQLDTQWKSEFGKQHHVSCIVLVGLTYIKSSVQLCINLALNSTQIHWLLNHLDVNQA
jgi:hypothetical protein